MQELAKFINFKIREHIDEAIRTNPIMFVEIDHKPRDGLVSWDEYQGYWLRGQGIQGDSHMKKSAFDKLDRKVKESIARMTIKRIVRWMGNVLKWERNSSKASV